MHFVQSQLQPFRHILRTDETLRLVWNVTKNPMMTAIAIFNDLHHPLRLSYQKLMLVPHMAISIFLRPVKVFSTDQG